MPGLGRIYREDPRDRAYGMERVLATAPKVAGYKKLYPMPYLYDQGQTPMCVGYSCSGAMTATEYPQTVTFNAPGLYQWANTHDGDSAPHDGTTVRAGFQGLLTVGDEIVTSTDPTEDPVATMDKVLNYLWADTSKPDGGASQIIQWLLTTGPVVIGIDWYNAMFTPDANGYVHPVGTVAGGHAILVRGVNCHDTKNVYFVLRNSWGPWGVQVNPDWTVAANIHAGDCLLNKKDMVKLLKAQGEAGALGVIPVPVVSTWEKVQAILEKAVTDIKSVF